MAKARGNGNGQTTQARLSSAIKSARDIMRKDEGLNGETDRIPQLAWILFLKCFDDLEMRLEEEAILDNVKHRPVIPEGYRWRDWGADPNYGLSGPDFLQFVNDDLLPTLRALNESETQLVIGSLFGETYNRMLSGYLLRDVVNLVSEIHFQVKDEIFTLSHLYESMLQDMRDAAGDSGEFYTPRPVVKLLVDRVAPKLGETVLDPAAGTAGILGEKYE